MFVNYYEHCGTTWTDVWDCTCNDKCPVCGAEIEPFHSEDEEDNMADKSINWDRPMLERFKKAHADAVAKKVTKFTFDGNEFLVAYAKYLIQYLEGVLK
jgi:hypothetical protein